MRSLILAVAIMAMGAGAQIGAAQTAATEHSNAVGRVCVLPNPAERPSRISPGGDYNPDTLTLRIDKREPIRWPHKKNARIDELRLQERHLVVLTSDGKRIQSFWFRFSDYNGTNLCIRFDGYQGVDLGAPKNALWCRVKEEDCW